MTTLTCYICNGQFRHDTAGRRPKTCPGECRTEHRRRLGVARSKRNAESEKLGRHLQIRKCENCGESFTLTVGGYKYCSEACRKKLTKRNGNAKRRAALNNVDYDSPVSPADLALRDGPQCCHCGDLFTHENWGEVDHIIPLSRGGVHAGYNCQLLCVDCNNVKGSKIPLADFRKALSLWPERPKVTERDPRRNVLARRVRPNSGYRGVVWHNGAWRSVLQFEGRIFRKGGFDTAEAAALHYNFMCGLVGLGPEYHNEVRENADT